MVGIIETSPFLSFSALTCVFRCSRVIKVGKSNACNFREDLERMIRASGVSSLGRVVFFSFGRIRAALVLFSFYLVEFAQR